MLFYKLPRKKVNPVRLGTPLVLEGAMLYTVLLLLHYKYTARNLKIQDLIKKTICF